MIKIKLDKEGFLTQWDIERKVVISGRPTRASGRR